MKNDNENWFAEILNKNNIKHSRQATWGFRIFDFWISEKGIAVEIDGLEHNKDYDQYRDNYNYQRSGIIVLRVKNKNEIDAENAINSIINSNSWIERRSELGILTKSEKRRLNK